MTIKELKDVLHLLDNDDEIFIDGKSLRVHEQKYNWNTYIRFEEPENTEQFSFEEKLKYLQNETSKTVETKALNIADVMHSAYKAGYEQRVIDQLKGALDGNPVGSHYNDEKLNKLADKYVSKHCA